MTGKRAAQIASTTKKQQNSDALFDSLMETKRLLRNLDLLKKLRAAEENARRGNTVPIEEVTSGRSGKRSAKESKQK
jgi:hypothetical protein